MSTSSELLPFDTNDIVRGKEDDDQFSHYSTYRVIRCFSDVGKHYVDVEQIDTKLYFTGWLADRFELATPSFKINEGLFNINDYF